MIAKRPIRDLERDLKREPGNLALRLMLAAAYREAGRAADAVELYRSVARAYMEQGRAGQAAAVCRSALEIAPTDSELYGMLQHLQHLDRSAAATIPPPVGAPMGSAPAMPVPPGPPAGPMSGMSAVPTPQALTPPSQPGARVLPAEVSLREVGSVAPATVKHVPPPPPRALSVSAMTPTGRNSTLDTDTPLPDPLPLHESTGRDSLVEMVELLTGPAPSLPPAPPPLAPAPTPVPPIARPVLASLAPAPTPRAPRVPHDEDSETIVPLTQVRKPSPTGPVRTAAPPTAPPPVRTAMQTAAVAPAPARPAPRTRPPGPPPGPRAGNTQPPPTGNRPPGNLPRLTDVVPPPPVTPKAPPPAPIDDAPTELGALPSSSDFAADLETRRRPKLSARDLSLLDLDPVSVDPEEAVTNPGHPKATEREIERPGSVTETQTARHPAALVEDPDDGPTGDTGDTGKSEKIGFDEEPTHPPPDEQGTDTGAFDESFDAALSALGPDGSVLEGPLGVFSMLPPEAAAELGRRAVVKQYDAGEVIIREGDLGDACYVIVRGAVVVQRRADEGEPEMVELARLTDGSLFGEFALLADRRRHATVTALNEVEVYEIPRLLLRELAAVFPEVGPALERFYRERLLANLLRTTPLFSLVPEDQRPALLARFHPLHADSGQAIVRQGDRAGGLYLIVLGAVDVVRRVGERRAVVLATLGEGAYFGEMSLLSGEMASASVVAAGPCELAVLPPRDFYDLVSRNPELWTTMRTVAEARKLTNAQILAGHTGVV